MSDGGPGTTEQDATERRNQTVRQKVSLEELIDAERQAFNAASEASRNSTVADETHKELSRSWFGACADVIQQDLKLSKSQPASPLPGDAMARLSMVAETLATGNVPDPVRLALARDGHQWFPGERRDIALAVFYVKAARGSLLKDGAPNKSVRDAFGVTARTVQIWVTREEEICRGLDAPSIHSLHKLMLKAGERYQQAGRRSKSGGES